MRILTPVILALSLTLLVSACNTIAGMGQDMKVGGQKIQNAAR